MAIHLDTSVVLGWLFAEDRVPPAAFWSRNFVSSRLLAYEVFARVHARGAGASHTVQVRQLVAGVDLIELEPRVRARVAAACATGFAPSAATR